MRFSVFFMALVASPGIAQGSTDDGISAFLKRDWNRALQELKAAADQGSVEALFWLGQFYSTDRLPDLKDDKVALTFYRQAAEKGHPLAEWYVADSYEKGRGTEPNKAESIRWLQAAAYDEVTAAQLRLSLRYRSGDGVPKDLARADKLLRFAATPHDDSAKYNPDTKWTAKARTALARGELDVAAREFAAQAARGVASAQLNLGVLYLQGRGVSKDPAQAAHWLGLAAEHDYIAAYTLAVMNLNGGAVDKNVPRAIALLEHATKLSSFRDMRHAHYLLPAVYGRGYLGRPDYIRAMDALFSIPQIKMTSTPFPQPPDLPLFQLIPRIEEPSNAERFIWLTKAAQLGHLQSQTWLGHLYELGARGGRGEGPVQKDLAQAYFWYSLASDQGDALSKTILQKILKVITPRDLLRARLMLGEVSPAKTKTK